MRRVLKSGAFWSFVLTCSLVAALFLSPLGVQQARADNLYAKIQGTITDPAGAVLSGAKLTATNVGTNISYTAETSGDGNYVFLNLPIGTYRVTATSPGFRTFTATGITLVLDQVYQLNIKMEIGQISEQVLVEASNVQVETTNTQLGTVINGDTIVDMPLNGRNWTQLQQLQPGVMSSSDRFGTYSTNGSQSQQNSFLINGQDSNDLPLNTPLIIPSPDAISEFSMVTNTINPEYGRNSGAIMNAAIKSGTNSFHGDGFEFYRDTFLNTSDFFTHEPAVFHQNQFGGTIGGPILKNHLFGFFSYQGSRFRQPQASTTQTVYSQAELNGNFSQGADVDPVTGVPYIAESTTKAPMALWGDGASPCPVGGPQCAANTTSYATLFRTGMIPTQDFNPIAQKLVTQFVPLPNGANNAYNFTAVSPGSTDQYLWQVDQTFNSKDSIRTYGFIQTSPTSETLPFTGATLPGFPEVDSRHYKQFTASWTHVFSSSLLNEFRLGYTRFNLQAVEPQTPVLPSSYGFDINVQSPAGAGLPVMSVVGANPGQVNFTLGFSTNGPQPRKDQTYQIDDNFSWVRGRHTFKFGFDGRRFQGNNPFYFENDGDFSFGAGGLFSTGNAGADFLLGIPDSYGQSSGGFHQRQRAAGVRLCPGLLEGYTQFYNELWTRLADQRCDLRTTITAVGRSIASDRANSLPSSRQRLLAWSFPEIMAVQRPDTILATTTLVLASVLPGLLTQAECSQADRRSRKVLRPRGRWNLLQSVGRGIHAPESHGASVPNIGRRYRRRRWTSELCGTVYRYQYRCFDPRTSIHSIHRRPEVRWTSRSSSRCP